MSGMSRWVGRVALVTGASEGIGASICKDLVRQGMVVIGCARDAAKIEQLAAELAAELGQEQPAPAGQPAAELGQEQPAPAGQPAAELAQEQPAPAGQPAADLGQEQPAPVGKLHAIQCDMSKELDILAMHKEIADKYKRIDVCINNAVSCINSSLVTGEPADWNYMLQVNVVGLCINTAETIKLMRLNKVDDGQIIHMSSMDGHRIPPLRKLQDDTETPWFHVYFGTKFMVRALAEGLRQELKEAGDNIRVSTISPGPVETGSFARTTTADRARRFFDAYKCLETADVAEAVKYILSVPVHVNVNDVLVAPVAYNM